MRTHHGLCIERVDSEGPAEISVARPVGRRRLLGRIAELTGQRAASRPGDRQKPVTQLRGSVLVAEDHPTNQLVIRRQLALIGLEVEIAGDGAAALDLIKQRDYEVLITDLHMPRLDGLGLSREVRALERAGHLRGRLPIIAMTADVVGAVPARCREAGMDDVISKPIALEALARHLARWLDARGESGTGQHQAEPQANPLAGSPVDLNVLRGLVGDDPAVIESLSDDFQRSNDALPGQMRTMLERADFDALRTAVHRFIGSARTLGAHPLCAALETLQLAARGSEASACAAALDSVDAAYARARAYLRSSAGGGRDATQSGNSEGGSGRDR